jgi:hypothetical protein
MRLPDFLKDSELNDLRSRMGTEELGTFKLAVNPDRFTMAELEALIVGGIEVFALREVRALPDHTLAYKDRRVVLHRRDVILVQGRRAAAAELPHLHVADCPLVRGARTVSGVPYLVSAREDGEFRVNLVRDQSVSSALERLPVCLDCLDELGFDGYEKLMPAPQRMRLAAGFTITRFFTTYHRALVADREGAPGLGAPARGAGKPLR